MTYAVRESFDGSWSGELTRNNCLKVRWFINEGVKTPFSLLFPFLCAQSLCEENKGASRQISNLIKMV